MDARVTLPTPVIQILVAMPFSPVFNNGDRNRATRSELHPAT
jgi:hypothetical protein